MNPLRTICLLMGIFALATANTSTSRGPRRWHWNNNNNNSDKDNSDKDNSDKDNSDKDNSVKGNWKPTDWLSVSQLESLPAVNEVTIPKLDEMSLQEGADLLNKMYHVSQAGQAVESNYAPKPSEISAFLITHDNKKVSFKLNQLPKIAQEQKEFGKQEVTILITGLPERTETVKKAVRKLVQAYMQRYNGEAPAHTNVKYEDDANEKGTPSSSEENEWSSNSDKPSGNLVVIELGNNIGNMKQYISLDVEKTGEEIANVLVQLLDEANVPREIVHIIGTNVAAHVAGSLGRQYTRVTGHQLRRITGLDPSEIYGQNQNALRGLARGDAEFVDAIHTSAYGLGTPTRSGDVDFYPNGPSQGVPGADSVVEASMRAVRYFAESVVPGNERNFPAVGATSLQLYKDQNGNGKRVYMGISTEFDVEGDFILQVNSKSPFGRSTPAQKQQQHRVHKPWKSTSQDN